jgi:DNA-binding MarR family transcriptional regulator
MKTASKLRQEVHETRSFRSAGTEAAMGILRTADVLRRRFEKVYGPYGITGQQYNVLRILRGARPELLPTMEIAQRMIEQTPGITRLLDRLEEKGWVSRERNTEDRRCVLCTVTRAGLELLEELDEPVDEADDAALAMLDVAEVERLIEILDKVKEGNA